MIQTLHSQKKYFDQYNPNYILIEQQPAVNKKMFGLSLALFTYFSILFNNAKILFVNARHKLKTNIHEFIPNEKKIIVKGKRKRKNTYYDRKKYSIQLCKQILPLIHIENVDIIHTFQKSKKKDDFADCFLQCIYYLQLLNKKRIQ